MKKYFGTDGIRFIYDESKLTIIKKLALSLNHTNAKKIIIGRDSRASSKIIEATLINYLQNIEVIAIGEISTPGICYLSNKHKCLGLVITASHNSCDYNGIKIFLNGYKLTSKEIDILEATMDQTTIIDQPNKCYELNDEYKNEYLSYLSSLIKPSKYQFIFDGANGALSSYLSKVIKKINPLNIAINTSPDGNNINDNCGSQHLNTLKEYMKSHHYQYGFSFDGDGDRVVFIQNDKVFSGDEIIYIFSKYLNRDNRSIAVTTFSNLGLIHSLKQLNINTLITDVGDSNVLNEMLNNDLIIGGENSGHIINKELLPTGDGLLNAITLINLINEYGLDHLIDGYIQYPSFLTNLKLNNKENINHALIQNLITEYKKLYSDSLSIVLRKSGTEDIVRLFVSSKEENIVHEVSAKIITYLKIIDNKIKVDDYNKNHIDEKSTFGEHVTLIGENTIINSCVSDNTTIDNSTVKDSVIRKNCQIGPYSHIRQNSIISDQVKIGNFVEIKNTFIAQKTKVSHLTYLGDCTIGKNCNIGCGVVSVNYDGLNKHRTLIGDNSFVGCNVNLIAPINIGNNTYIAAGSTITKSIKDGSFVIARNKETIKENYAKKYPFFKKER